MKYDKPQLERGGMPICNHLVVDFRASAWYGDRYQKVILLIATFEFGLGLGRRE